MKLKINNYTFNAAARTVTFTDYASISLAGLLLITNVTDNKIIYNFAKSASGGTVSNNVLTLNYNTTSMSNTDSLQIFYDDRYTTEYTLESILLLRRITKLLEASDTVDTRRRQRITIDAQQLDTSGNTIECQGGLIIGPPTTGNAAGGYQAGAGYGQPVSGTTTTGYTNSGIIWWGWDDNLSGYTQSGYTESGYTQSGYTDFIIVWWGWDSDLYRYTQSGYTQSGIMWGWNSDVSGYTQLGNTNSGIIEIPSQGTPYMTNTLAESWYQMTWEGPVNQRWRVMEDSRLIYQKNIRKKLTFS